MDVVHVGGQYTDEVGEFGGARFYSFNRRPEPPPEDDLRQDFIVGYIDPSTSVLREQIYRAKTAKEAADSVSWGISGELYSSFGVEKDVRVVWVKDKNGEERDFRSSAE